MSTKILCIGEPLKESVGVKRPDGTLTDVETTGFAGDMAPNMASYARMAADALGVKCDIDVLTAVGPLGDGPSDAAIQDLQNRGLGIHPATRRIPGKTLGSVTNLKTAGGETHPEKVQMDRQQSAFRDVLNDASDDDLRDMVKGYSHVVVSGIPLACVREREKLVKLLQFAKAQEPPSKIVVSTNLRPANWKMPDKDYPEGTPQDEAWKSKARHWLDQIVPMADMVFANTTDENAIRQNGASEAVAATLRTINPSADIVVTDDDKPIFVRSCHPVMHEDVSAEVPVAKAGPVLDTTGAGDSLAATVLISTLKQPNLRTAVERGTHVAAQVIGFKGALPEVGKTLSFDTALGQKVAQL